MLSTLPAEILKQPASELMTAHVTCILKTDSIVDTLQRFNNERHSFYPLIDVDHTLIGVVTREDFYNFVQVKGLEENTTIDALEYGHLPTIQPDIKIEDCLETMVRGGSNKLLVCNPDKTLAGILSFRDILSKALQEKV